MATSRFVQITDKEINEIKINSILKNAKDPTKFRVKLFQSIYFIFSINSVLQQRKYNILGLQIISCKNITLVYKDGQLFLVFTCVKILINNCSPQAQWFSRNIHLDFVSVNIPR